MWETISKRRTKPGTDNLTLNSWQKTLPSAGNSVETVGDFMWEDRLVCPTVQKPLLKSLKRLLSICEEAEKEKKRGDWYSFPRMATCFPQMATNGNNTDWRDGNAHSRPLAEYENCGKWGLRSLSAASIPSSSSTETQTQIRLVDKTHCQNLSRSTNLHATLQKRPVHASVSWV